MHLSPSLKTDAIGRWKRGLAPVSYLLLLLLLLLLLRKFPLEPAKEYKRTVSCASGAERQGGPVSITATGLWPALQGLFITKLELLPGFLPQKLTSLVWNF